MDMRRLIVAILTALTLALPGPLAAQSQGELEFFQRRIDNIRDFDNRRLAQIELEAARDALRQNNAAEFKKRGDNILFIARLDAVQYTR
jgi:hypothetical protein